MPLQGSVTACCKPGCTHIDWDKWPWGHQFWDRSSATVHCCKCCHTGVGLYQCSIWHAGLRSLTVCMHCCWTTAIAGCLDFPNPGVMKKYLLQRLFYKAGACSDLVVKPALFCVCFRIKIFAIPGWRQHDKTARGLFLLLFHVVNVKLKGEVGLGENDLKSRFDGIDELGQHWSCFNTFFL